MTDETSQSVREQALIRALARALQLVEMVDIDEALNITAQLEDDVRLLVGSPIILVCPTIITIAEPLPEPTGCIFGTGCIHRSGGAA
jgi:hypothetical protein